ncbi:hypothetical protein LIER_20553 [Lithospermum erythrorhizon]|uniref:Integrase catalytic domain-containing protein n=1 Tax=Lithospermum erythrorhizon TaxID=34254 RepID=A0AAV3QMT0_LITER
MEHVPIERNKEVDRLSQLATTGYGPLPEATVVEWVEEESSRTKEVMNNASESEEVPQNHEPEVHPAGVGIVPEILPGSVAQMHDKWGVHIVGDLPRIAGSKRCGVPWVLVTDNGTHFTARKIENLCVELDIDHIIASVSYPQANGQVEVMKPGNLQRHKEMVGTGGSLVYGPDALLTVEIHADTTLVTYYDVLANEQSGLVEIEKSCRGG